MKEKLSVVDVRRCIICKGVAPVNSEFCSEECKGVYWDLIMRYD